MQNRLYDTSGALKFHLTTPAGGDSFDRFSEGLPSNPVRYDAIDDESSITDTPGPNPTNEWLLRADWGFNGAAHFKHGDGDTGEFISDTFLIDETSSFTMDLGGGAAPNGLFLHDAESGDVIISESLGGGFLHHRAWTTPELQAAGITGQREVYLRVVDGTTRGWGTVSLDNIVVQNAGLPAIPEITSFTASSQSIAAGTPVSLSWTIVDPLGGTPSTAVTPDAGDVTGQSSVVVNPLVTTTYTLIAENADGSAAAQLTVTVDEPPVINSFTVDPPNVDSGSFVTLSWDVENAETLTIDQGIGDVTGLTSTQDDPTSSRTYTLTATSAEGTATASAFVIAGETLTITEFLAINNGSLRDEDDEATDWIEICNTTGSEIDLDGWYLTDDPNFLTKWRCPPHLLGGGDYVVIFASGKDRAVEGRQMHTNFRLNGDGEYLALVKPDGVSITREYSPAFPQQHPDVSYGLFGVTLERSFFDPPTPGLPNEPGLEGFVGDTTFSVDGGFYDAPIQVEITTATPGARVRFTVDGSAPSDTHGTRYTGPIQISSTTTLRAMAFRAGLRPTNVDTQSYFFIEDVVVQDNTPRALPVSWAGGGRADYGMDPEVTGDPRFSAIMNDALRSVSTISLVMDADDLFDPSFGIYANPGNCCSDANRGPDWERPVSVEYFNAAGEREFQVDAGIRIQGGASRQPDKSPKHSLRLLFKEAYGAAKLEFQMFDESPANRYDTFSLRAGYLDAWIHDGAWGVGEPRPQAQYVIDKFVHDTFGLMEQTSVKGNFAHLYINGHYWGLYNPIERIRASWLAEVLGGNEEDWDVVNLDVGRLEVQDGSASAYNALLGLVNGGVSSPEELQAISEVLDLNNLIDYMLINIWIGNNDWPGSNWTAARRREPPGKYRFFTWDAEASMETVGLNVTGANHPSSPAHLFHRLRGNEEFRLMVADRIQRHFFNDGVLAPDVAAARYAALAAEIELAVVAESARWGDYRRDVNRILRGPYELYTRDDHWIPERDRLLQSYFPQRTGIVFNQLRALGLFPAIAPPEVRVDGVPRHGGTVGDAPVGFTIPASGAIYFTTDGTDPRRSGTSNEEVVLLSEFAPSVRALVPSVANGGSALIPAQWTGLADPPNLAAWKSGNTGVGFEHIPDDFDDLINLYVPEMMDATASVYVRIPFTIANQATLDDIESLTLNMKYDSGFVAYLNGTRVAARNEPGVLDWQSEATADRIDRQATAFQPFDISAHKGALQLGSNVLAIHAMNDSPASNDMLVLPQLVSNATSATGTSPTAQLYAGPFMPLTSVLLRARVLDGATWSALVEAPLIVGTPADASNLVVSEINHHPLPPQTPGEALVGQERKDYEFLELMNISDGPIDLSLLSFSAGIDFRFPLGTTLPPQGRLVLAENAAAFAERYGFAPHGEYGGNLANEGETITILGGDGTTVVQSFTYDDKFSWPESADGVGFSLVLIAPRTNPDHNDPFSWRPSVAVGGNPGSTDAIDFVGDPVADSDNDGLSDFLEHALAGTSTTTPLPTPGIGAFDTGIGGTDRYLTMTFERNLAADDVIYHVEQSEDLVTWLWGTAVAFVSRHNQNDGTVLETWRSTAPISVQNTQFLRLNVTGRPGPAP